MRKIITGLILLFCAISYGQIITGKVTDLNGTLLPGVTIVVVETNKGTTTNFNGEYSITAQEGNTLKFTFIGMRTQNVTVGNSSTIDVVLVDDIEQLNEAVVTAFGIKKEKRSVGYAVQEVGNEELTRNNNTDVLGGLQGKVAGVNINASSGAAGAGSSIIIRGITSLNPNANNQPLFVVDGIPISNEAPTGSLLPSTGSNAPSSAEQFSFTNRGADINPNDIESVSILKGPAATALYGLRAANGVVLITTKKGKSGETQYNFKTSLGVNEVSVVPEVQTKWREGRGGEIVSIPNDNAPDGYDYNDGRTFGFWSLGPEYAAGEPIYDNFRDFFRTGLTFNNSFSASGGGESYTYFGSLSRLDDKGIVPNTDFDRTSLKLSGSINITNKFTIDPSISYIRSEGRLPNGGDKSIMSSLSYWTPTFDVNDYLLPNGNERNYTAGVVDNPRYFAEVSYLDSQVNRILANTQFKYEFTDWASVQYQIGIDNYHDSRRRFVPPDIDPGSATEGFIVQEGLNYNELTSNLFVTLSHEFNEDFSGSLLVGNQISDIETRRLTNRAEGLNPDNLGSFEEATNFFTDEGGTERKIVGLFGDLRLDYKNTLYLNITGRNDWSSTLPKENRSFFYPSFNLSYVLSQTLRDSESLPEFITYAKLRASYAEVGKDAPPYVGVYYDNPNNFPFGTVDGFSRDREGGSNQLKPERTSALEFGTELKFFENRLSFDLTYYIQKSKDQILPVPVAQSSGFDTFVLNAGEIENKGFEALVNIVPIKTDDFNWDITLNFSTVDAEVLSLPEGIDEIIFADSGFAGVISKLEVGGAPGDLFGYVWERDENGNRIIQEDGFPRVVADNPSDRVKVGNALPDWTGSIGSSIKYQGLALSFLLERKEGGDLYDSGQRNGIRNGNLKITEFRDEEIVLEGVLEDGSPNNIPVVITEDYYRSSSIYNRASEILVQDASWWRLRNVTLSYDLSQKLLEPTFINSFTLSFTGTNLWIDTPFRGYDPEGSQFSAGTNAYGFTGLNIPNTRSYLFGINLNF
ncbi:SusC/RagA family TonB-linked outer membrane protein [Gillisia marina]|uniref:SusC/RagA family TonB-linked outer membrane protein n=1 Tax=Gillisia marina TaxID=1167637 RepID=UPI00029B12DA|nr:SusC/RagA family TonB-linked outer membrane protein [Gillisia marina]